MKTAQFEGIIKGKRESLRLLKEKKILLVTDCACASLLDDRALVKKHAALFSDTDYAACEALLNAGFIRTYPYPVLIDFRKAVDLFQASTVPEVDRIKTSFLMSRINFMGTDGMRGKVVLTARENCIGAFLQKNVFTPALVEITCFSFAKMLSEKGVLYQDDAVVVGNDGRDKAYGWRLTKAMVDGFARARLNVLDLGAVPTALVPHKMLQKGYRGGAMLTASHNPSNQNGIKFFIDGKKLLPEGELGDYALSAYMYIYCSLKPLPYKKGTACRCGLAVADGARFVLSALPKNASALLKDTILVLDTANGASAEISERVLDALEMVWSTKNENPAGVNINKDCGAAEIEGTEQFSASGYDTHVPFVKEIFDKGRTHDAKKVYGIALDGDGDRGFVLYYDKQNDCVHVIDGDKCGYILAEYFIKIKGIQPGGYWFVTTIESDIMTAVSAHNTLGLKTKVVTVGDKWIGNFKEGKMLVGLEISGHCIFPVSFKNDTGEEVTLFSGIGLLTGLMTLAAIKELDLPSERIIAPFDPGFSKTCYTYFVDKSRFCRNSSVWKDDCSLIKNEADALKRDGTLPADTELVFENMDDPNVLYITIVNKQGMLGCIFVRNSGTEDKTAAYVKGKREIKHVLVTLAQKVKKNHIRLMKNEKSVEYKYEAFIMNILKEKDAAAFGDIKAALEKETGAVINESDLYSVVHGLKKEGRVVTRKTDPYGDSFLLPAGDN